MRPWLSFLLPTLLAVSPTAAQSAPPSATATVEWNYRPQRYVIVGGRIWPCREIRCVGPIGADDAAGRLRACRAIAQRGHRVLALETASGRLDEAELADCNRAAG